LDGGGRNWDIERNRPDDVGNVAAVWRDPEDIGRDAVLRRSPKEIKGFKTPTIPLTAYSTATPSLLAGGVVEVCVPP
jgi:hypothetical protein